MSEPYKIREVYKYSEMVYVNSEGDEVARERIYDDSLWDTTAPLALEKWELEDYFGEE